LWVLLIKVEYEIYRIIIGIRVLKKNIKSQMCAKYIQYLLYLVTSLKSIGKGQMIQIELINSGLEPIIKEKEVNKKSPTFL
jgi:hypothetical protein